MTSGYSAEKALSLSMNMAKLQFTLIWIIIHSNFALVQSNITSPWLDKKTGEAFFMRLRSVTYKNRNYRGGNTFDTNRLRFRILMLTSLPFIYIRASFFSNKLRYLRKSAHLIISHPVVNLLLLLIEELHDAVAEIFATGTRRVFDSDLK